MKHYTIPLFLFSLVPFCLPASADSSTSLNCPDTDLASYLIALIDVLYNNGLTVAEEVIVHLSETDEGYALLEDLYMSSDTWTFLAPTDAAWQSANIWAPFSGMGDDWGTDVLALHALQGDYSASSLSSSSIEIASTFLLMTDEMNATDTDTEAYQAVVLYAGDGGTVIVDGWWGNSTTWSDFLDTSSSVGLDNIKVLPIDTVLSLPPSLSETFETSGLSNISSALDVVGIKDEIQELSAGGFTFFAPIDSVWSDAVKSLMTDESSAAVIVGNHYTTNYTLYSPAWQSGSFDLQVASGETLTIRVGDDGISTVTLGGVEAPILKSDIILQNGVMHVIDAVLYDSISSSTGSSSTYSGTASTGGIVAVATDSHSASATASTSGDSAQATDAGETTSDENNSTSSANNIVIGSRWLLVIAGASIFAVI